ncbi:hypothetical protein [Mycolicibacterium fortuitum]|uniref:hypothetical protein n=1 Tax=Mycolicibacterium fortuitum TaxID=1766 RepID=UPI00241FECE3|nr:hypothetical protein [Mycolicibacterium fortuitum]MDG5772364.1 hypothetical protein [Mycolicibacterium fortuitum]MDG5782627.1 hypothetical protein [Mycolicibacterium fortuitum]
MSGQLVGEVLAASDELRARELSPRAFHALVAIAEKAGVHSREASVRWDHIRAGLYGASKRTAERAVEELKAAGLVSVVRPGFKNQHAAQAPVYRVLALLDTDSQVSVSEIEDHDSQVSVSTKLDTDKSELDTDKTGSGYRHPGVVLDGSLDGFLGGGRARLDDEPRCERHRDPVIFPRPPDCRDCQNVRESREAAQRTADEQAKAAKAAITRAIGDCPDCDDYGRLDDLTDCPLHANHRRKAAS